MTENTMKLVGTPTTICGAGEHDYTYALTEISSIVQDTKLNGVRSAVRSAKIQLWLEAAEPFDITVSLVRGTFGANASHADGITHEEQLNACFASMWTRKVLMTKHATWKAANVFRSEFTIDVTPYARKAMEEALVKNLKGTVPLGLYLVLQRTSTGAAKTITGLSIRTVSYDLVPIKNKPI